MVELLPILLYVGGELGGLWVLLVWLPQHVHVAWVDTRYGTAAEKRVAIQRLLDAKAITLISYEGCPYYHSDQFELRIVGPFGEHLRRGTHARLRAIPGCAALPEEAATAFEGYMENSADVIHLLWDRKFLETLPQKKMIYAKDGYSVPWSLTIVAE